jgi:hypothetical protein
LQRHQTRKKAATTLLSSSRQRLKKRDRTSKQRQLFRQTTYFLPLSNFSELVQQNSKLSTTLQALGKEWTEFVQARLREDSRLLRTLGQCREFPSVQRAYMQFWEKALSQYEEEAQRLMRITRGVMEDATYTAQESQERIEATNGNADGRGASSSSSPPTTKRANHSRRDSE